MEIDAVRSVTFDVLGCRIVLPHTLGDRTSYNEIVGLINRARQQCSDNRSILWNEHRENAIAAEKQPLTAPEFDILVDAVETVALAPAGAIREIQLALEQTNSAKPPLGETVHPDLCPWWT